MKHDRQQHEGSNFVRHIPCPDCGSRDNNALFSDGHTYCFGCGAHRAGEGDAQQPTTHRTGGRVAGDMIPVPPVEEIAGLRARKITDETCRHFRYFTADYRDKPVQVAPYYDADGRMVAQKIRGKDKKFAVLGDLSDALPFGAQCWPKTGRMIVVTEGEIDALAMSQVQGNKWPVVSIASGAGGQTRKYIAQHLDYFKGFEKVVLMFDMDAPGREAAKVAAEIIGSRAHIAEFPQGFKDASDMLVAGKTAELINAMWNAKRYQPEGIVDMATLLEDVMQAPTMGVPWVFESLTKLTYGKRLGELAALGAGTGVGKTDFLTQDMVHMVRLGHKIGIFSLEQQPRETALRLIGKAAACPVHIPEYFNTELIERTWKEFEEGKVFFFDHFGAMEWDKIEEYIEFLYHSEGVQYFYLDHLTALAAAEENEKEGLERIMAAMGALVKRIPIHVTFVSHLATPEGKPHEEGGRVMIRHFKGSRTIGFWAHFMFGMERNQQADDLVERQTTTFRVLKDRYTGRATGESFYLGYERETGLLFETEKPDGGGGSSHGFKDETIRATGNGGPSDF